MCWKNVYRGGLYSFITVIWMGCSPGKADEPTKDNLKLTDSSTILPSTQTEVRKDPDPQQVQNLVDIQVVNPSIVVDLKYATSDNFMGKVLYDTLRKAYLQKEVAQRLSAAQDRLQRMHPGYTLCVYDALRPRSVQWEMWRALDTMPVHERVKFVSNPRNGSVHNYGAAVDLTILDAKGLPLDMGAGYDDPRKIAYPELEQHFLASGELTQQQLDNRLLLRKIMRRSGFIAIPTEWWHFNAYPRAVVKRKFVLVE